MPLDLGPLAWTWLAFVVLGASFVRGFSGFGFAALLVAGAGLVTDPIALVPAVLLCDVALGAPQWLSIRGSIDWRRVGSLFAGCLLGVPVGVWLIATIEPEAARAAISLWVLLMALVLLRGWQLKRPQGMAPHAVVGVVSGLANGAAIGGLPVAAFFAAQPIPAAAFRATLVAYFLLLDLWTLPVMWRQGLLGRETMIVAALGLPLMILGLQLGSRRFIAAPPEEFRRFAIWTLMALAAVGFLRSFI
jgi:uncharacterized membrane protein YfcA